MITNLYWLRVAIHICGSRKELARRARIKKGRITEWLNGSRQISLLNAIKIEMAVGGQVKRLQLVSRLDATVRRYLEAEQIIIKQARPKLTLEGQVILGLAHERVLNSQKRTRKSPYRCENFHKIMIPAGVSPASASDKNPIKGRTDAIVAQYAGFGNYRTYRDAKDIVARGISALIAAVDQQQLSIYRAAQIAKYPEERVIHCLKLLSNKKELFREMKKSPVTVGQPPSESRTIHRPSIPVADERMVYGKKTSVV